MKIDLKNIFSSLILGVFGGIIFTMLHNHFYQKTFAVVKMDEILSGHLKEYGSKNLSSEERDEISKKFALSLENVLNKISEEERVILFVAPATVTKLPDYTKKVKEEINVHFNQ